MLPILYLRGQSTGDCRLALELLLGTEASGFSAASISGMNRIPEDEYEGFRRRSLTDREYVSVRVEGIRLRVRLGEDKKLSLLVMIEVRHDGTKEVVAIEDGYRESTETWANLLRDLKGRGVRQRWRRLNARELLLLVRAGARFQDGLLVERTNTNEETAQAA